MHIMQLTFYILIGVFGLLAIIHLLLCLFEKEGPRKITKPITTLLLMAAIMILVLTYPEIPYPKHAIWIAGIFCVLGDLFSLKVKSKPLFITGSIFYAVGHCLNIFVMVTMLSFTFSWWVYLIAALAAIIIAFAFYPLTRLLFGKIAYVINLYLSLHLLNLALAILLLIDGKPLLSIIIIIIGYALYFVSDFLLAYAAFGKDIRRRDFYIMLLFYAGQVLIMLGLANTLLIISQ